MVDEETYLFLVSVLMAGYYFFILNEKKRIFRRWWVRPSNRLRFEQGAHDNLIKELRENDALKYNNYMRMSSESFNKLLSIIGPTITKKYRSRKPINPSMKLEICIRYLATGNSMTDIADQFRIGRSTVGGIIEDTTKAIYQSLKPLVMPEPTRGTWLESAEGYWKRWNFPHCIGSVDGKYITIEPPPNAGSTFYTHKGSHSTVLMAICDYRYRFLITDIGAPGRAADSTIFRDSNMGHRFENNEMDLPAPSAISSDGTLIPYFLVGDEAFGLKRYLQRPYPGRNTGNLEFYQQIFNYRLSRARRTIENAFGILAAKWRIFRAPIQAKLETIDYIVAAAVCLHNFVLMEEENLKPRQKTYCPPNFVDREENGKVIPGMWRKESAPVNTFTSVQGRGGNNQKGQVYIREKLAQFFMDDGAVYWQWTHQLH